MMGTNPNAEIEDEYIHNLQQQIQLMEQENKLLKEREKERTELMNLDLNDGDHMIQHLDKMKEKYIKMKNQNEDTLKTLAASVLELNKEKRSLVEKQKKLKAEEQRLQLDANKLATEQESNKERTRQTIETLRKELDAQQRKAKQSTIEQTEARNELLELNQAQNKCSKDFDELKAEKEQRSISLSNLRNKLENEHTQLLDDIAKLKKEIFESPKQLEFEVKLKELEEERDKLRIDEKYQETHHRLLEGMNKELHIINENCEKDKQKTKLDYEEQKNDLESSKLDFAKKLDAKIKELNNKELIEAKERKNTRAVKNNELEEQWNIRKIEMRKQRDKQINESEEKKELQIQHQKLDEAQKDQAQEISNQKHRTSELVMGIEEKQESLHSLDLEVKKLKHKEVVNEDLITKLKTELEELKQNDKLDKAIDLMPIDKLKTYQENQVKIQDNLKNFNSIISNYVNKNKNK